MSTRSIIAIEIPEEKVKTIYCHWDGYPSGNGKILKENYKTKEDVLKLIELGDLSILGHHVGVKTDFKTYKIPDNPKDTYQCLAYGRDRDETDTECKVMTKEEFMTKDTGWIEYVYLFKDDKWFYAKINFDTKDRLQLQELTTEVIEED